MPPGITPNAHAMADPESLAKSNTQVDTPVDIQYGIKNLYQKEDNRGKFVWTDKYPGSDDLDDPAENEETERYAILVRKKKSYDSRKKLEIDSIVVQSHLIKDVLSKVLKNYPGVTTTLKRLVFQAPFNPFVHRWTEFEAALDQQNDDETRQHLQLLYITLKPELKEIISARNDYIKNEVITYNDLWTILQPGCTLYSQEWGRDCGSHMLSGTYAEHVRLGPCYSVSCQILDYDGDKFGYATKNRIIPSFPGTMKIADLEVFPLEFHPQQKKITAALLERGKLFEKFHGYHYKMYRSFAIGKNMCGEDIKVTVDSRIIIDTFAYAKFNPNRLPNLAQIKIRSRADETVDGDDEDGTDRGDKEDDSHSPKPYDRSTSSHPPLTNERLLHCTPFLRGYALKLKRWLSFFVDAVTEITWSSSAFRSLVLPADQKELILAFTESQIKHRHAFDDIISGKGKGIIMLLSGGPGIGKTLTAESVAETMQVPLYTMSAGQLGVASSEVESNLSTILEMTSKWNAVLLLDECDVFLEARSAHDLERNKVVSIFLRTLEYYEGILFLTTNRLSNMDPAFQSRIHISMAYPDLDAGARRSIWQNFLARDGGGASGATTAAHELAEEELEALAQVEINGRQIKNVLKTAGLLAAHKGAPLRYEHLRTVLKMEGK